MMCEDCPAHLNINDWQNSVHQADTGVVWTPKMDYEVRRFMVGAVCSQTAGKRCGQSPYRVESRAQVLMIEAREGLR